MSLWYVCPVFIFLRGLFEVFIDRIELIKGDFLLKLVQMKDANLDDSFCTFVGPVSGFLLSLFVYSI